MSEVKEKPEVKLPQLSRSARKKNNAILWRAFQKRIMHISAAAKKSEAEALNFIVEYKRTHCLPPRDLSEFPLPNSSENESSKVEPSTSRSSSSMQNSAGPSNSRPTPKQSRPNTRFSQPNPTNPQNNRPIPSLLANMNPIVSIPSPIENLLKLTVYNLMKSDDTFSTNIGSSQSNNASTTVLPQNAQPIVPNPQNHQETAHSSQRSQFNFNSQFHSKDAFDTISVHSSGSSEKSDPVKLMIIPENHPDQFLKGEDFRFIEESILDLAIDQMSGSTRPQFLNIFYKYGYFIFNCANEKTADWLRANFNKIKKPPGIKKLILSEEHKHLPRRSMIVGYFHSCREYESNRILSIIDALNEGLNAVDWKILRRIDNGQSAELVMSVSQSVMEILEKRNGKIFFKFGTERLRLRTKREREIDLRREEPQSKQRCSNFDSSNASPP